MITLDDNIVKYGLKQVNIRLKVEDSAPLYSAESIDSPEKAIDVMAEAMKAFDREHVCIVNLDNQNRPINFNIVSIGGISEAYVPVQSVFKAALLTNASSVIMLHNHPSGSVTPSQADISITEKLIKAGQILDIPIMDHIIIGGVNGNKYSIREEKPELFSARSEDVQYFVHDDFVNRKSLKERIKEMTDKLEHGVTDLFQSDRYREYLNAMAKFHHYSLNNSLLIAMARPDATHVASIKTWNHDFGRYVKKGEKGIPILVPTPYKKEIQKEAVDDHGAPILDADGKIKTETRTVLMPAYKIGYVYDVAQTDGKPLPEIAHKLTGDVKQYGDFMKALKAVSPVPIAFDDIRTGANGYYDNVNKKIVIKAGMSQEQTIKTCIHEISHAICHDRDNGTDRNADKNTMELTAESCAFCVCSHLGIDSSDYSFGYLAAWSNGKDTKELRSCLQTVRDTTHDLIEKIDKQLELIRGKEQAPDLEHSMTGPGQTDPNIKERKENKIRHR